MELRLGYAVFDGVVADVRAAVDTLDESRRRAAGEVEALLDTRRRLVEGHKEPPSVEGKWPENEPPRP